MITTEKLIDPKVARIISLLSDHETEFFHLQMISKQAKVPLSSTFRVVKSLVDSGIIEMVKVGNFKIYQLGDIKAISKMIDPKIKKILGLLASNKIDFFHLQMISKKTKVPLSSTFRLVNQLVDSGYVKRIKVGNFKIYQATDKAVRILEVIS